MNVSHLSKSERDQIIEKITAMTDQQKRDLLEALNAPKIHSRADARLDNANYQRDRLTTKVTGDLRRLGLLADGVQASSAKKYTVREIDTATKAANWDATYRMALKSDLATLGLLAE